MLPIYKNQFTGVKSPFGSLDENHLQSAIINICENASSLVERANDTSFNNDIFEQVSSENSYNISIFM